MFYYFLIFYKPTLKQEFYHINDDLLVKQLLGEADAGEEKAVADWINSDAANANYYLQLKQVWDRSKMLAVESTIDENKAWQKFQQRIDNATNKKTTPLLPFSWMKIAASALLLVGLALSAYLLLNKGAGYKEVMVQTGQNVLTDTLYDGSMVTLNKKSSIIYEKKLNGKTRTVALKGEAFFKVTPDKLKPFIITVNDVRVTVVGTSFNVKSENGNTEVVVETGIVRVTRSGETIDLKAGEKLLIPAANGQLEKKNVTDQLYNYYRTKEFVCDDTPLWKLVEVLNKAYDSNITIGRNELRELRINTTFNNESLDKILEIIHLTFDITVTQKDGQIILQ